MKKIVLLLVAFALLIGSAGFVYAQHARGGHREGKMGKHGFHKGGHGAGMGIEHFARQLNLTDQQKEQARAIGEKRREAMKQQMEAQRQNRHALIQAIFSDNPNQTEIQQRLQALQQGQQQATNQMVQGAMEFNSILTSEQRSELQKNIAEHQQRMEQRREKMKQRMEQRRQQRQSDNQ